MSSVTNSSGPQNATSLQTQNAPSSNSKEREKERDGFKIQLSLRLATAETAVNTAITAPSRVQSRNYSPTKGYQIKQNKNGTVNLPNIRDRRLVSHTQAHTSGYLKILSQLGRLTKMYFALLL